MKKKIKTEAESPSGLAEAILYFADKDNALAFLAELRWPNGVRCPHCFATEPFFLKTRRIWKCRACRKQFSVKVGTIFEDSPLGLDKWLPALWMLANCKNGISSYELGRALDVTQKTAWFMLGRIRLAMQTKTFKKLSGTVEIDETFIGGRARNMHAGKRKVRGSGIIGKTVVMGLLERHGRARTVVVKDTKRKTLRPHITEHVERGAEVHTDSHPSYDGLTSDYEHRVVDHAETYVKDNIHTNGLENFWSLLKRAIHGTYVSVEPFHLFRYLDEQSFRYNERKDTDLERFVKVAQDVAGKRLTYSGLTGKNIAPATT